MLLDRNDAALIVVDMQNAFCRDEGSIARIGFDNAMLKDAVPGCARLIAAARGAGVPVIHTRYVYRADYLDGGVLVNELMPELREQQALIAGSWDAEIVDELTPAPGEAVLDKNRPSAFIGTPLEACWRGWRQAADRLRRDHQLLRRDDRARREPARPDVLRRQRRNRGAGPCAA